MMFSFSTLISFTLTWLSSVSFFNFDLYYGAVLTIKDAQNPKELGDSKLIVYWENCKRTPDGENIGIHFLFSKVGDDGKVGINSLEKPNIYQ